jgi:signal transduction histidine kinase
LTEKLASRVAGLKLGGIVAVLLLPMLALSYVMVSSLREDIAFSKREMLGIEMNALIMPVTIGIAAGKLDDRDFEALRTEGGRIAGELGAGDAFSTAIATLLTYGTDKRLAIAPLAELQSRIAAGSNIVLDPYAETYYLGTVFGSYAPNLLSDYTSVATITSRALRDKSVSRDESIQILIAAGSWLESQRRVVDSLKKAAADKRLGEVYAPAIAVIDEMGNHPRSIVKSFQGGDGKALAEILAALPELNADAAHIVDDVASLWSFSAQQFASRLEDRLTSMQLRLYSMLSLAIAACVIGVGGAALMFRSTLRQLDQVKLARDSEQAAREEAEAATSEIRRINEDVVKLNADLARNLEMLREAQDDGLRKGKMAQLGQLTATVAHELRNPLGAVRTSAFLLARKVKDKGLGVEPQLERINNGITRCDNIIAQLLDFARAKAIQPEAVDLDDWLAKLIEEEASKLPASLSIECRLGLSGRTAEIDPARMSRAVINLISNASEAMLGKGDAAPRHANATAVIRIASKITDRGFEVSIADNGPGIAPEHMDKIFEPLFTTKSFGTGLGLPAVKKILEQHGGGLDVATAPGQGASFTMWWPLTVSQVQAA